jgi:hypothetical protein
MSRKKQVEPAWRCISVTMLQGNRDRLRDAMRIRNMPIEGWLVGPTKVTAYVHTTRTAREVEDELRAQLQFSGWLEVEEEE